MLSETYPAETADLLEALPPEHRSALWEAVLPALFGVSVPLLLKRMGIDPALSGAVVLTTVSHVIGFLSFLGLASLLLI